jgi:hypothetical protein
MVRGGTPARYSWAEDYMPKMFKVGVNMGHGGIGDDDNEAYSEKILTIPTSSLSIESEWRRFVTKSPILPVDRRRGPCDNFVSMRLDPNRVGPIQAALSGPLVVAAISERYCLPSTGSNPLRVG